MGYGSDFTNMFKDIEREVGQQKAAKVLTDAVAEGGCKSKGSKELRKKCFDDFLKIEAAKTNAKPLAELKREVEEAAVDAFADEMTTCMTGLEKTNGDKKARGDISTEDTTACEDKAKIKAADKLGKAVGDFDAEDLISIKEKGAQKKSAKTRGDCVSKIDELIEDAARVTAETKCDNEAQESFKIEKERVEGAADQMAKGMEVCHQEAEAAAKTCHTAITDSESTAGVTAKKACETALDTA